MNQNYDSFNVFYNEKDRNKELVFKFLLRQVVILSQVFVFNFLCSGFRCIMK